MLVLAFLGYLPPHLPSRPQELSVNSFCLYNLPITPLFTAGCMRNHAYVHGNKDLRGEGGTPPTPYRRRSISGNSSVSLFPMRFFLSLLFLLALVGLLCAQNPTQNQKPVAE